MFLSKLVVCCECLKKFLKKKSASTYSYVDGLYFWSDKPFLVEVDSQPHTLADMKRRLVYAGKYKHHYKLSHTMYMKIYVF